MVQKTQDNNMRDAGFLSTLMLMRPSFYYLIVRRLHDWSASRVPSISPAGKSFSSSKTPFLPLITLFSSPDQATDREKYSLRASLDWKIVPTPTSLLMLMKESKLLLVSGVRMHG